MKNLSPTRPSCSESTVYEPTPAQPETGKSFPPEPTIAITEIALKKIVESKEKLGLPVKGLRVRAHPRSPVRAAFSLRFVPAEEPESSTDTIQSFDGIDLYIDGSTAPYLDGATIDFVFRLIASDFAVEAPPRKLDTPEGRIAAKIQQVLEAAVNPSLANHGGEAVLIDFKDGIVFLELKGGCQGCSMAATTLKEGIETSIRQSVPEVQEVRDVTKHASGMNPYFQS